MIVYKIKKHQFGPWWCEHNGHSKTFTIDVGQMSDEDMEYFVRRMRECLRIPPRYLEYTNELA